ncbi:MAG: hypothetical protein CM15mP21_4760 [Hyphomicrobiales bacterium]|nr:MAG: hypothetical protein CM15mP21_4760 [Hyphomicrobiales bacterium]
MGSNPSQSPALLRSRPSVALIMSRKPQGVLHAPRKDILPPRSKNFSQNGLILWKKPLDKPRIPYRADRVVEEIKRGKTADPPFQSAKGTFFMSPKSKLGMVIPDRLAPVKSAGPPKPGGFPLPLLAEAARACPPPAISRRPDGRGAPISLLGVRARRIQRPRQISIEMISTGLPIGPSNLISRHATLQTNPAHSNPGR